MIDRDGSAGLFERTMRRVPDGTLLRLAFYGFLLMAAGVVAADYTEMTAAAGNAERLTRVRPLPLARPKPGDQIRPYLPATIPVGPDRGEPVLPGYDGPVDGEAMAEPMRFLDGGGGRLTAIGRIDAGTADALAARLADPALKVRRLILHSPGGSVSDAIRMARLLREKRIDTMVPDDGYCASACPLMFAGGVERRAGSQAWIGLHQVYAVDIPGMVRDRDRDRSIADIQATIAEAQQLLLDMGVQPEVWIKAMKTPPDALYVLTGEELEDFSLVTPERFGPPMLDRPEKLVRAGTSS